VTSECSDCGSRKRVQLPVPDVRARREQCAPGSTPIAPNSGGGRRGCGAHRSFGPIRVCRGTSCRRGC
jgi:hypothetical protein